LHAKTLEVAKTQLLKILIKSFKYKIKVMELLERLQTCDPILKNGAEGLIAHIAHSIVYKKVKKGECILREGEICNKLFYVQSGMLRVYELDDGKEINTWFVNEGDFFISITSFHKEMPSIEFIEALEDSVVLSIRKNVWNDIIRNNHHLAVYAINELLQNLCEFQIQAKFLRYMKAEDRYKYLQQEKPEIIKKVAQKHLASFLGIDVTYLSKIINNKL